MRERRDEGDLLYYDGTNLVSLPVGSENQVLKIDESTLMPVWEQESVRSGTKVSKLKVDIVSAGLSYFTLCFALNYFVLPYVKTNDYRLISHSFMFGLVIYGVYDFTCGAIFEKWDKKLMIIDTLWGGILYMITNYLTNILHPSF